MTKHDKTTKENLLERLIKVQEETQLLWAKLFGFNICSVDENEKCKEHSFVHQHQMPAQCRYCGELDE